MADKIPSNIANSLDGIYITPKDKIITKNGAKSLQAYQGFMRSSANRDLFQDFETHTSVRNQFTRDDYEYFRSSEAVPKKRKDIVNFCMKAYEKVGLLHNVIDLMADFVVQGIRINHPNEKWQRFLRRWFKKVKGMDRSERFLNLLYRAGNVIVKKSTVKIPIKTVRKYSAKADYNETDIQDMQDKRILKRIIPGRYTLLNPLCVEKLNSEIANFIGVDATLAVKITETLRKIVQYPKSEEDRKLIAQLPTNLLSAIKKGDRFVALDNDKVGIYYYKRDDWDDWAHPMAYCILDDLIMLEKMKLADLSALDGAISQVRLWLLGDIESGLFPNDSAIQKLADILLSNTGGGAFDLIWGPDLRLIETGTDVHQFLGSTKYEPVWTSIFQGLGIPPTLTGASTASGFTNNFISMQTLIRRLDYGRAVLLSFWEQELENLQEALGFKERAYITFDRMTLSDEAAEKALLLQLVDRDIISQETVIERFGEIPELEVLRLHRENRNRKSEKLPPKASPWHNPQQIFDLMKIALQMEQITPGEAGLTDSLDERRPGEETGQEVNKELQKESNKMKGQPQQGRPLNSKDGQKRKQKQVLPRKTVKADMDTINNVQSFMSTLAWVKKKQDVISEQYNKDILAFFKKKDFRSLTAQEFEHAEQFKFALLSQLTSPNDDIDLNNVSLNKSYATLYKQFYDEAVNKNDTIPPLDYCRNIQCIVHTIHLTKDINKE